MCVIFLSVGATQGYKLVVIANRDELLDRPTDAAKFWEDSGFFILGGKKLNNTNFDKRSCGRNSLLIIKYFCLQVEILPAKARGLV